jgi:hypothetical protein
MRGYPGVTVGGLHEGDVMVRDSRMTHETWAWCWT